MCTIATFEEVFRVLKPIEVSAPDVEESFKVAAEPTPPSPVPVVKSALSSVTLPSLILSEVIELVASMVLVTEPLVGGIPTSLTLAILAELLVIMYSLAFEDSAPAAEGVATNSPIS